MVCMTDNISKYLHYRHRNISFNIFVLLRNNSELTYQEKTCNVLCKMFNCHFTLENLTADRYMTFSMKLHWTKSLQWQDVYVFILHSSYEIALTQLYHKLSSCIIIAHVQYTQWLRNNLSSLRNNDSYLFLWVNLHFICYWLYKF
jgi:hypothetical protein